MIKFLLIVILVGYVLYKLGTSVRVYTHSNMNPRQPQRPIDDNIHINTPPPPRKKDGKEFKGGEYIDYEEVK